MQGQTWTPELTERLKLLADGTRTAQALADMLGVSRSAVVGKMFRMSAEPSVKLSAGRIAQPRPAPKPRVRRMPQFVATPVVPREIDVPVPVSLNFSLVALTDRHCHWPHGDSPDWDFCGHPVDGGPYCSAHMRIARGR